MPQVDPASLQQYIQRTNRRIAALEQASTAPSRRRRGLAARQFEFVKLCEPLYPGQSARGNVVTWSHDLEEFVESGTGCVIVYDDMCRTFALPGMVIDTMRRWGKFTTWQEFGISNVPAITRETPEGLRFEVGYSIHCYWDQPVYIEVNDPEGDFQEGDVVFLTLDREGCQWLVRHDRGILTINQQMIDEETTTTTPGANPCEGQCRWIWNATTYEWELDTDGCEHTTSTTPEPTTTSTAEPTTTSPGETTTTTPCPCLDKCTTTTPQPPSCEGECLFDCISHNWVLNSSDCPEGDCECVEPVEACGGAGGEEPVAGTCQPTTTTTPETTTTTPEPCNCLPPPYCGVEDEECVDTYCVAGDPPPSPLCGATTTTCDCTTTTPDPSTSTTWDPDCSGTCRWFLHPEGAVLLEENCSTGCTCWSMGAGECGEVVTPCSSFPPTDPPPPGGCWGRCQWIWHPILLRWIYDSSTGLGCEGSVIGPITSVPCTCRPPSEPPADIEECVRVITPCNSNADPCCTSTTDDPCNNGHCKWEWDELLGEWVPIPGTDSCPDECPCYPPPHDGDGTCDTEVAYTYCGRVTTSTTPDPSTSTTPEPTTTTPPTIPCTGLCRLECIGGTLVENPSDQCGSILFPDCNCSPPPGGLGCTDDGTVVWSTCGGSGGTTTTGAPTTTTTAAPTTTTSGIGGN